MPLSLCLCVSDVTSLQVAALPPKKRGPGRPPSAETILKRQREAEEEERRRRADEPKVRLELRGVAK